MLKVAELDATENLIAGANAAERETLITIAERATSRVLLDYFLDPQYPDDRRELVGIVLAERLRAVDSDAIIYAGYLLRRKAGRLEIEGFPGQRSAQNKSDEVARALTGGPA